MKIIRIIFLLAFVWLLNIAPARAEVEASFWQTVKSAHFVIYYEEAPAGFIDQVTATAEDYYNSIVENLGYRRFEFWNWDNRAKIFFYKDSASYQKAAARSSWSGASVNVKKRAIKTYIVQEKFLDSILVHELTHIIFREFVGHKTVLPLWVDEGVASSQEKSNLPERLEIARGMVKTEVFIKLDKLADIRGDTLIAPNYFYAESASLIVFLLESYGKDKFLSFSRALRDGEKWPAALTDTYRFKDMQELESKWKEFALKWTK